MKLPAVPIFALLLTTLVPALGRAEPLTNGFPLLDEIGTAGDVDSHTALAQAGDYLLVHIGEISDTPFIPRIDLFEPPPSNAFIGTAQSNRATRLEHQVTVSGDHRIDVLDGTPGGNQTGVYQLHAIRTSGALASDLGDPPTLLTDGITLQGELTRGDVDGFEFGASDGATIDLELEDIEDEIQPWLRVYAPDGERWSVSPPDLAQLQITDAIPGRYVVAVANATGGAQPGTYELRYSSTADLPSLAAPVPGAPLPILLALLVGAGALLAALSPRGRKP